MSAALSIRRDGNADSLRDFGEPKRVAAVGGADHQHPVALWSDRLDRGLAVRGGVANVLAARRADGGKPRLQRLDHRRGVVDRKRGLREEGEVRRLRKVETGDISHRLDERDRSGRNLAEGADHLGVARHGR